MGRGPRRRHPRSEGEKMSVVETLPNVRGRLTAGAPLAPLVWFKAGGTAEWLFEPKDADDLGAFLAELDPSVPVMGLGLGSNLIVRDGGVPGIVVRLGKAFARVEPLESTTLRCGGGASGILVSSTARDAGNGGAYGREVKDVLVECELVLRSGQRKTVPLAEISYSYRHSELPAGSIVVGATFRGHPEQPAKIQAEMDRIAEEREASQPLRSRTGGSTFKNPPGTKAWKLIDAAGCRGLRVGGAEVSEKHCNFLLNLGEASAADIEALGEEVRRRVREQSGVTLEWEIQRVGEPA